ncbi:hypothetical protein BN2475_1300010 [Paraburkholderia ribeironis]|uniref:Uncharacterized protein n=1 Tax=Paraburkholderia ribeironis TaxID=1247936 RepID=A0A1N7SQL6_9BURK|nr:hypothetical protein BN2475_1300010 [Paraburkholderia ribeironis]
MTRKRRMNFSLDLAIRAPWWNKIQLFSLIHPRFPDTLPDIMMTGPVTKRIFTFLPPLLPQKQHLWTVDILDWIYDALGA